MAFCLLLAAMPWALWGTSPWARWDAREAPEPPVRVSRPVVEPEVDEGEWATRIVARVNASHDWTPLLLADLAVHAYHLHPELDPSALENAVREIRAREEADQRTGATILGSPALRTPLQASSALIALLDSRGIELPEDLVLTMSWLLEEQRTRIEGIPAEDIATAFGARALLALHEEAQHEPRFAGVLDALFHESVRARADDARSPERAGPKYFNLLLVTVDTLRAGETGFLGYDKPTTPNLDDLASRSVVFERAYAMASYTGKALAPMMIGKYPSETLRDGSHLDAYFAGNTFLAERLQVAGWHTMGAASLWYFGRPYGLTQGCDVFDLSAIPSGGQYTSTTSPQLADAAIKLLDAHARDGRFFFWVHFFDPHSEYLPHPGAPLFADPAKPHGWRARALYDGEVWFTDRAIGRLLDHVKAQPWGEDTIIVVTADHGESMAEHGFEFRHGRELWESLVRIPLLIHVPGAESHRVPVKRSVVDLVPTLLDLLGIPQPAPGELSGRSMMPDLVARQGDRYEERDVYFDMPAGPYNHLRRGVITGDSPGIKLIELGHRQYRLFDLAQDPNENVDLARDATRLLPALRALESTRTRLREIKVRSPRSRSGAAAAAP